MTNFPNGVTTTTVNTTGAVGVGGALAVTGATTVTGASTLASAAVTGLTNTGTLKVGAGDTINSIVTYTSAAVNIAAVNVLATTFQKLALTVTGVKTTDTILNITPTNAVADQAVIGNVITAANNVSAFVYTATNTNASNGQTFKVTVKR